MFLSVYRDFIFCYFNGFGALNSHSVIFISLHKSFLAHAQLTELALLVSKLIGFMGIRVGVLSIVIRNYCFI